LRRFGPLTSWERLRDATFAAPSCFTLTCDGVSYRHTVLDWQGGVEVSWEEPKLVRSREARFENRHASYCGTPTRAGLGSIQESMPRTSQGIIAWAFAKVYPDAMSTIHEIEQAVRGLNPQDLAMFRAWFAEYDADAWDRQFEQDVAAGRLDQLAEEALSDLREGRCTDL
jgi:hypothetical protein